MSRLLFYLRYAFRNLRRDRRWSSFAVLSVAAGVATVVALRSLGLAIGTSLVDNVRLSNHGDISVNLGIGQSALPFSFTNNDAFFNQSDINRLQQWVDARGGQMSAVMVGSNIQVTAVDFSSFGRPTFINSFFIDPQTYPPTGTLKAVDPVDIPLADLFSGGNQVVISKNLADAQGIKVGDQVRVSRTEELFTVVGIVGTEEEANLREPFSAFFGFAYFTPDALPTLGLTFEPNRVSIILGENPSSDEVTAAGHEIQRMFPRASVVTTPRLLEQNKLAAQLIGDFIVVMGLGALLIGGVGIMNTMLVLVRRRTNEIAALKTFGLKGRQIALLFLSEALLLGLAGTAVGSVLGVLLGGLVNSFGETFLQQRLVWTVYPEALAYGLTLGMVVTLIFGVAPVLTAVKVRPAVILRPNETYIPKLGVLQWLFLLVFVVLSIGLIVGQIVSPSFTEVEDSFRRLSWIPSPYVAGILGVAGTLLVIGILICLMWVLIWLIGKLPSFGSVDLRLALRNLSTGRMRTATTLLALTAGMFALSGITFVGEGTRQFLQLQLTDITGGNVLVFPLPGMLESLLQSAVNNTLRDQAGIQYHTNFLGYSVRLTAVDGVRTSTSGWGGAIVRDTDNPNTHSGNIIAGRDLTLADRGKPVVVVPYDDVASALGIHVGSMLTFTGRNSSQSVTLEVVGMIEGSDGANPFALVTMPPDTLPFSPAFSFTTLMVDKAHVNEVLVKLSTVPLVFSLDIGFIDGLLKRLIDQFTALPAIVGLLSLLAAAVIMANTVALATLERRRQIGILKAVGLKGRRVLRVMLIETTIIGLLSAIIGIGLSSLAVTLMTALGGIAIPLPADSRLPALLLVLAAVAIGWTSTFLSAQAATRERVMNVLRYE